MSSTASTTRKGWSTGPDASLAGNRTAAIGPAVRQTRIYHHALATGFSRGYLVSAGVLAVIVIIALFMMRVGRQDLADAGPPAPAGDASSPNLA